jgi:phosphatidylglycerophosphatase A
VNGPVVRAPARLVATLGPVGYAPIAPATAGSAVVTFVAWFLPAWPLWAGLVLLIPATVIAVWSAGEAEKTLGHDAKPIVIDELVGQWITLLFAPRTMPAYFAAFVLFRVFDVWKPFGARQAQNLPGGWGVVADDVIAGIVAGAALHLVIWIARSAGWTLL